MRGSLQKLVLVATMLFVGAAPSGVRAQQIDLEKSARIKAAYLLNFVRYTQWPDDSFKAPDSPIVLTRVGECQGDEVLSEVIRRSEPINGRRLVLRTASYRPDEPGQESFHHTLEHSHLVYFCAAGPEPLASLMNRPYGAKVLTVGDTPDFASHGGMLGFVLRENRIVFEANPKAIQKSLVAVSAKVLKLAQIVEGGENP